MRTRVPALRVLVCAPLLALVCASLVPLDAGDDPNACDAPGEAPDVIVGDIEGSRRWGAVAGITAFSVGTWSCNVGTCELLWQGGTNAHPVIGQNMYRLRDGRFEQIGQSWLKHGFFALSIELCDAGCVETDGSTLGVHCADPYSSGLNGEQEGLGPKFEVNASTGEFPYPFTDAGQSGGPIYKRLQVRDTDIAQHLNVGALWFVEAQYVTRDDAEAGNHTNNASYRQVETLSQSGLHDIHLIAETVRGEPAIVAWTVQDPEVLLQVVDVDRDGRFLVGSKAFEIAAGHWHYEYAVQNLMSQRGMGSFSVPIPAGATIEAIDFHDVDYHSGEPFDGTDWSAEIVDGPAGRQLRWSTETFDQNPNANALRWGTLYNFRFVTDVGPAPAAGVAVLGLFRPGTPSDEGAAVVIPGPCDFDGACGLHEDCDTCPADCVGPPPQAHCCGDGACDSSEDECSCSADCGPCLVPCDVPAECDDGLACNGAEDCVGGSCAAGEPLCGDRICDEATDSCLDCVFSDSCSDGTFCNGVESCVDNACMPGAEPCPGQICVEAEPACVDCLDETDCDDGLFCNGAESCIDDVCVGDRPPCSAQQICDEQADSCVGCALDRCSDGAFCNGVETCIGEACLPGSPPCAGGVCDELRDACLDPAGLQALPGDPLHGLAVDALARFEAGRSAFGRSFAEVDGLGPAYNGAACAGCHRVAEGGVGPTSVTRFGLDDGGAFDPLTMLGGSLLQELAIRPECTETLPVESNVVSPRTPTTVLGAGLVEVIDDATLEALVTNPPPGISGRAHDVPLLEAFGTMRIGRYGYKAQQASVPSIVAEQAVDHLGLTNRLLDRDHAPNGDPALLDACDAVPDPEDVPDPFGADFVERAGDYLRYLAPPPQTPKYGLQGEERFVLAGCSNCHRILFTTPAESEFGSRTFRPYSDFLLHDMGANGDPSGQGDALPGEVRTTPLWGLRLRDRLWHDGRFDEPLFDERVRAAIAAHDAPGSEAAAAAQAFAGLSTLSKNRLVTFLGSLGRVEFDSDGDGAVSPADLPGFVACFSGPGGFYNPDAACAIHDVDADGDVDHADYAYLVAALDGRVGGGVPDGLRVPGEPLSLAREGDDVRLTWSASCVAGDTDYAVYQGNIGDWDGHGRWRCSTGGATTTTVPAAGGDFYYLVVPVNGVSEGSYGTDRHGVERPPAGGSLACFPQWLANECD